MCDDVKHEFYSGFFSSFSPFYIGVYENNVRIDERIKREQSKK